MNNKGFGIIDLLFVIVVVGCCLYFFIPYANEKNSSSRIVAFSGYAKNYVNTISKDDNLLLKIKLGLNDEEYFSVCDIVSENGISNSPFDSNWVCDKSYVYGKYDESGQNYVFFVQLLDEKNNYLPYTFSELVSVDAVSFVEDPSTVLSIEERKTLNLDESIKQKDYSEEVSQ